MTGSAGDARWMVVEHSTKVAATPQRVWRALTSQMPAWWRAGFFALPDADRMTLEARPSGRMYESAPDGSQVTWASVTAIRPGDRSSSPGTSACRSAVPPSC